MSDVWPAIDEHHNSKIYLSEDIFPIVILALLYVTHDIKVQVNPPYLKNVTPGIMVHVVSYDTEGLRSWLKDH